MTVDEWWEKEEKDKMIESLSFWARRMVRTVSEQAWNAAIENQWQPIETAPRDETTILVYFRPHGAITVKSEGDKLWQVDDFKHGPFTVRGYMAGEDTHWMPRPKDPT